jgi:RNA polymerase sigma-70 factor (ECF subfamily)
MDAGTGVSPAAPPEPAGAAGRPHDTHRQFLSLFLQNQRRLYAYILALLPNRADADDVLQDASLVMLDKFDPAAPPTDFLAWARRFAYHKVLDFYKKSHRAEARLSRLFLERVAKAAGDIDTAQLDDRREALAGCLEKLDPKDRDLLNRRMATGATTKSTSEQVGRSVEAVYKALAKIRHGLFECVQKTLAREGQPCPPTPRSSPNSGRSSTPCARRPSPPTNSNGSKNSSSRTPRPRRTTSGS